MRENLYRRVAWMLCGLLGHYSKANYRAYAKRDQVLLPPREKYEARYR